MRSGRREQLVGPGAHALRAQIDSFVGRLVEVELTQQVGGDDQIEASLDRRQLAARFAITTPGAATRSTATTSRPAPKCARSASLAAPVPVPRSSARPGTTVPAG